MKVPSVGTGEISFFYRAQGEDQSESSDYVQQSDSNVSTSNESNSTESNSNAQPTLHQCSRTSQPPEQLDPSWSNWNWTLVSYVYACAWLKKGRCSMSIHCVCMYVCICAHVQIVNISVCARVIWSFCANLVSACRASHRTLLQTPHMCTTSFCFCECRLQILNLKGLLENRPMWRGSTYNC